MTAQSHPTFLAPRDTNVRIWRYVSLTKFTWLLQKRALYFCRSDLMGDPFEGYSTRPRPALEEEFVRSLMSDPQNSLTEADARRHFRLIMGIGPSLRKDLFLNCWHMNEEESFAMWKIYASRNDSVCIQSRFLKLHSLLPDYCFLGVVRYIDYDTDYIDWTNSLNYIVHKRQTFAHERELRSVIWAVQHLQDKLKFVENRGIEVPIDPNALVETIFLSPDSEPILQDVVSGLLQTYGITAPVVRSQVNAPPDWNASL
jgi:hypothetical protein